MTDLERSHDDLRALLILAGRQIRKLNFGKRDDDLLALMRRTLREARKVRREPGRNINAATMIPKNRD